MSAVPAAVVVLPLWLSGSDLSVYVLLLGLSLMAFAAIALQLILLSLLGDAEWAGGAIGAQNSPHQSDGGTVLEQEAHYAYLAWGTLAVTVLVPRNVVTSRVGRALRALAISERRRAPAGYP